MLVASLSACVDQEAAAPSAPATSVVESAPLQPRAPAPEQETSRPRGFTRLGTGDFTNDDALQSRAIIDLGEAEGSFTITLIDVPVAQAAQVVLGDTLGLNFAVAPQVQGMVTVQASQPVPADTLFETFETALALSGFVIEERAGVLVVEPDGIGRRRFVLGDGGGPSAGGVFIIPLEFVAASQMADLIAPVASESLQISIDNDRNLLFVAGRREDAAAVFDAVNVFDVDDMRGKSIARVPLESADPLEVASELSLIFDTGPGGAREGILRFLPNQTLRSIVIISANRNFVLEAQSLIRSYDRDAAVTRRLARAYALRNRNATELAPVLSELLAFGEIGVEGEDGGEATAATSARGVARVVADDASNAVIVYASAGEQRAIADLIRRLDDVDDQVMIEATIAEVDLRDALEFGVRYFFESGDFGANFSSLTSAFAGSILPGFNAVFNDGNAAIALNALNEVTDVNIVSSPSLMVLDNREATLNVGDQVPIATQSSVGNDDAAARVVNEIEQRDTGVLLQIKPRVSTDGRVILEIRQEVSDAVATTTSGIESPTIQQRIVTTTVAVDEGQSVVLGGLIREVRTETRTKIPFLGDLPVVGAAFRNTSDDDRRTELLIIIRPRVIRRSSDATALAEEYRERLSGPGALVGARPRTQENLFRRVFY